MSALGKKRKQFSLPIKESKRSAASVDQSIKNSHVQSGRARRGQQAGLFGKKQNQSIDKNIATNNSPLPNDRIKKLMQNLYPTLEQMDGQDNLHESGHSHTSSKANLTWKADEYASKQRLENRVLMSHAQRQLDQRLKNRVLEKYKRISLNLSEPYTEIFQQFKAQQVQVSKIKKQKGMLQQFGYSRYKTPEVTAEGISLYPEIRNKVRLLDFTKQRIKQKKLEKEQLRFLTQESNIISNTILKPLISRKRKQALSQSKMKGKWRTENQQEEMGALKQIKTRLRRIYTRTGLHEPSEKTKTQLQNSNLMRHQHKIIRQFQSHPDRVSVKSKNELMVKFNDILNQYARSPAIQKIANQKYMGTLHSNSPGSVSSLDKSAPLKLRQKRHLNHEQNITTII